MFRQSIIIIVYFQHVQKQQQIVSTNKDTPSRFPKINIACFDSFSSIDFPIIFIEFNQSLNIRYLNAMIFKSIVLSFGVTIERNMISIRTMTVIHDVIDSAMHIICVFLTRLKRSTATCFCTRLKQKKMLIHKICMCTTIQMHTKVGSS